ncbi:MAG: hypothetical protein AAB227_09125 [Pseudomonadota bacterium]
MNIDTLLAKDFSALVKRLDADGFAERILKSIRSVERRRLIVVGGAGALGAAVAATQFQSLIEAFRVAIPSLNIGSTPMVMAALLFAMAGGATALIAPSR